MTTGGWPLAGRRIVTTRDEPGELDRLLEELGADVVNVPLIEVADPPDGGAELTRELHRLDEYDWLVVTSRHGAARVIAAAARSQIRMAAVGTATAAVLERGTGRPADLVPLVQTGAALVDAFPPGAWRVLVAQADRATPAVVEGLIARGCDVVACTAYVTRLRTPSAAEVAAALSADALALASGSAARAWAQAVGPAAPPVVCAIGPATAAVAGDVGLKVTAVAADHSLHGLVRELVDQLASSP